MYLHPFLGGGQEVLPPILNPLDGAIQFHRRPRYKHLFRLAHHDLGAKGAADKGRDNPHLVLGQSQRTGQTVADRNRGLGGIPHSHLLAFCVPMGHNAPILESGRRAAVDQYTSFDDNTSIFLDRFVVALFLNYMGCQVRV